MFDRFEERARWTMAHARQAAQKWRHDYIGTEHLLCGLVEEDAGLAKQALANLEITPIAVRAELDKIVRPGAKQETYGQIPFTPRAKRVLELSLAAAQELGHDYIGTQHLLIGLVEENEGIAALVLKQLGATPERVRAEVLSLLGSNRDPSQSLSANAPPDSWRPPGGGRPSLARLGVFLLTAGAVLVLAGSVANWIVKGAGGLPMFAGMLFLVLGLLGRLVARGR
jgi:ATP-dependent Clp protease ATP-binding subunit ClpC